MNQGEEDSQTKCRERRRRRIEMRRFTAVSVAGPSLCGLQSRGENTVGSSVGKRIRMEAISDPASTSYGDDLETLSRSSLAMEVVVSASDVTPVFGTMSLAGMSRQMEDAIFVRTNICRPEFIRRQPVHYFGVYDGHGGTHVADLCRGRMHMLMGEELMRVGETDVGSISSSTDEAAEVLFRAAIRRCFERMDDVALNTCPCGTVGYQCGCHPMEVALSGSTAVVALVTASHIVVANCGDSRAVLCRGGMAVPLSDDHKPERPDEIARIEASGGRVIFVNGARVEGILAMSRALGDKYLKPIVTWEPDISFTKRDPEDECLILASDGLWDVLSNDLACEIASECLREGNPTAAPQMEHRGAPAALYSSRSKLAAALLTRLALGRRSADNISVIVVDLKKR